MKRITANQYQTSERYYKLPKILFEDEKYMDMKLEVKVAYSILKDRLELSLSRGWIDEEGAVYLVFSNSKLALDNHCQPRFYQLVRYFCDSF
ncbi:replication initiator protein A [Streptococcus pneumoniae]|uniref:Replication initiator protein A n=1 Tax=Streptococcus pneumoniae TaxID=1313 RepID=A0A0U0PCL1_STREE|nr:replication initiator protein A [Streptococcus pneumoniae]